jgi:hypothetical protein
MKPPKHFRVSVVTVPLKVIGTLRVPAFLAGFSFPARDGTRSVPATVPRSVPRRAAEFTYPCETILANLTRRLIYDAAAATQTGFPRRNAP